MPSPGPGITHDVAEVASDSTRTVRPLLEIDGDIVVGHMLLEWMDLEEPETVNPPIVPP